MPKPISLKPLSASEDKKLQRLINKTVKLWRQNHLTYDQAGNVGKQVRKELSIKRPKKRKNVIQRLSIDEEQKLIKQAYIRKRVPMVYYSKHSF